MEKSHLTRQVELEKIPSVDLPKTNSPEVRPLCGNKLAKSTAVAVAQPAGGLGPVRVGPTPHNAQDYAETGRSRHRVQVNLAKRAPDST